MFVQAGVEAVHESDCATLSEVTQSLRDRQHPLASRQSGENMVGEVRRSLCHVPRVARGADTTAVAGKRNEAVVTAITSAGVGKTQGKNAAFEVFTIGLVHVRLWGVVIVLYDI